MDIPTGITIGHARSSKRGYYCGRTFAGHETIGLGNQENIKDPKWREYYLVWLREEYAKGKGVYLLLDEMANEIERGGHVFLKCWCYKSPVKFEINRFDLKTAKCHCEIIAYAVIRIVERKRNMKKAVAEYMGMKGRAYYGR